MAPLGPKGLPRLWFVLSEVPKDPFTGLICPSPDQPAAPPPPRPRETLRRAETRVRPSVCLGIGD